jgi:uncharacterized protein
MSDFQKPNRLAQQTSPYLLQHAYNPVDWYPWGEEALKRAKREQRPVFLSIGYSACHWCHVMERESFENPQVAEFLNKHFVSIKVDREERPDLDHIYMNAVQVLTQQGGWPMSVFLTPELEPFYGGTYFPPEDRQGLPSFTRVLVSVNTAWQTNKEEVRKSAKQLVKALESLDAIPASSEALSAKLLDSGTAQIVSGFDSQFGGFGTAPKFLHTMALRLCLRTSFRQGDKTALNVATTTLKKMAAGGIHDHIGGGFHRYSVDNAWHVPHFEKMLYDNALLAETYLEAFQLTQEIEFATTARQILDYLLREMQSEFGGFYSTQDADSEGIEGKFYVWNRQSIYEVLSPEVADLFCEAFGVSPEGNWENGNSVLRRQISDEALAEKRGVDISEIKEPLLVAASKLLRARATRIAPATDTKILLSWNAMAMQALALGYQVLGEEKYLLAVTRAATFIERQLKSPACSASGTPLMYRVYKDGKSRFTAYLDDYAHWIESLLCLYECDFQPQWLELAEKYARTLLDEFWDAEGKHFFYTGISHETLCIRPRENHDSATPSGTAMAVCALLRLHAFTGDASWLEPAKTTLEISEPLMRLAPASSAQMLLALDGFLFGFQELALVPGNSPDEASEILSSVRRQYLGPKVIAFGETGGPLLLRDKKPIDGTTTLYSCRNFRCEKPWVGAAEIHSQLAALALRESTP